MNQSLYQACRHQYRISYKSCDIMSKKYFPHLLFLLEVHIDIFNMWLIQVQMSLKEAHRPVLKIDGHLPARMIDKNNKILIN